MIVSVIGLGYIGLPTAALLAYNDVKVIGVDINKEVVSTINKGAIHIIENGLAELVQTSVKKGYLRATTVPEKADVFIIAVPTPFKDNFKPNLSYVEQAIVSLAPVLEKGNLILLESTSPVGTTENLADLLMKHRKDLNFPNQDSENADIAIAYCPERVLPGNIIHELVSNDRVIGGISKKCAMKAQQFYKTFVKGECLVTNARTAEMCKLTENTFRDVNIAFANELSIITDKLNINVWELIKLANHHPRVNILQPGPGVGGHCIAVDPWFIVDSTPEEAKLIRTAREINDNKPKFVINQIEKAINNLGKNIKDVTIATFGLSFKADIDDLRESPAVEIAKMITNFDIKQHYIVEPHINTLPNKLISNKTSLVSIEHALFKGDIIVLLVNHSCFLELNSTILKNKTVIDTRGMLYIV